MLGSDLYRVALELGGIFGALGGLAAIFGVLFFIRDRRSVLLRQEVNDEQRRREQVEQINVELTKDRDNLRLELGEEKKKTDITGLAQTLAHIAQTMHEVVNGQAQVLDKLHSLNGGLGRAEEGLRAAAEASRFLASRIVYIGDIEEEGPPKPKPD